MSCVLEHLPRLLPRQRHLGFPAGIMLALARPPPHTHRVNSARARARWRRPTPSPPSSGGRPPAARRRGLEREALTAGRLVHDIVVGAHIGVAHGAKVLRVLVMQLLEGLLSSCPRACGEHVPHAASFLIVEIAVSPGGGLLLLRFAIVTKQAHSRRAAVRAKVTHNTRRDLGSREPSNMPCVHGTTTR